MSRCRNAFAVVAVAAALLVLNGCSLDELPPRPPGRVFRFNNDAEPETLDPALMTGVAEHRLAIGLFEGLVTYHPETLAPVPGVAESWDVSEDRLTYTFHLRKCTWSNGDPLTAEDFVYAWRRVLEPDTAAEYAYQLWYIKNAEAYTKGQQTDFSQVGIRAPDPRTIVVTLENPTTYFLDLVAFPTYMPVHRGCVEKHGDRWTRPKNIVSNGPFVLAEWRARDRIVMKKNPLYWDAGAVKLEGVEAFPIDDADVALLRYKTGELDWISTLPPAAVPQLSRRRDYYRAPYLGTYFFRFNCTRKPFDDPRVRKAFNLALDKAALCAEQLNGQYEPATAFVPPMMAPYRSPDGPAYDPARAAKLLAEAGYPGGAGFPSVALLYNTSRVHGLVAAVAQDMWKKNLGIDVNLASKSWGVYLAAQNDLQFDICRAGWIGDYMDPNSFLDMFVTDGGNNRTGWGDADYDRLIAACARTADPKERLELFRQAEDILINRGMPIAPIYFYSNLSLRRPEVTGLYPNPRDLHPFKYIDILPPEAPAP